jgi:probable HAF family extracellular repeat protein
MNSKIWTRTIALTLFAALALPLQLAAQNAAKQRHPHQYHHYQLVDSGTFGGPSSGLQNPGLPRAGVLNNRGTLVGWANTPGSDYPYCGFGNCYAGDAFQLQDGVTTDLGRLPGGFDSQVNWISANGLMTGVADNGQPDPLSGGTLPQIHGVFWENGRLTDMGTLPEGGYIAFPTAVNSRGEVVGDAQNTVSDPNPMYSGDGTQTRAFYWKDGVMQDIGTLPGGNDAAAALINERGQVAGWSYINLVPSPDCPGIGGFVLTTDSFIWDKKDGMTDIGGLGGTCTIANDLNNHGQIVGGSSLTGDSTIHAFAWNASTGVTDLLDPSDSSYGFAEGENDHGDVAGGVCDSVTCYAVLWRKIGGQWQRNNLSAVTDNAFSISINSSEQVVGNVTVDVYGAAAFVSEHGGPIVDLNTLISPGSGIHLYEAVQINDRGEIATQGPDANGNNHAVLLIPCDQNHPGVEGCDYSMVDAASAAAQSAARRSTPNPTQRLSRSPWSNRYHMRGLSATQQN